MSDLSSQLRQVADDAASQARPMAVSDVIKRGDRRRQRTMATRSLSGLSAVALGAAVIFTGAAGHAPSPASAAASHANTTSEQTTTTAGKISIVLAYKKEQGRNLSVSSLTYSIHVKDAVKHPSLILLLSVNGPKGQMAASAAIIHLAPAGQRNYSGAVPKKLLAVIHVRKGRTLETQIVVFFVNQPNKHGITIPGHSILQEGVVVS